MPNDHDQQKRAVADGILLFVGDLVGMWFGLVMLYIVGGLLLVGVVMVCEWLLGPEVGWRVGFWVVTPGGAILAIMALLISQKHERHRREVEDQRCREDMERIIHGG